MKLGPRQVRLVTPFWPTLTGRRLRFVGRRNAVQLQETALVVEGDVLRFFYLGVERFFGGVFAEWTTITVPYSRIVSVRYRSNLWVVLVVLAPVLGLAGLMAVGVVTGDISALEIASALVALVLPVGLLVYIVWRVLAPKYTVTFRAKDGTRTTFAFRVRSRAARKEFDAALAKYQDAARQFRKRGRPC